MCGRFTLTDPDPRMLGARFGVAEPDLRDAAPRFNIAPTDTVVGVRERSQGGRRLGRLRWGLVPHFADPSWRRSAPLINARAETLAERPAFRDALRRRRCLVCADGFYEWRDDGAGGRQPLHVARRDGGLFAFAGLWEYWRDGGEELVSCAIVTSAPNELMAPLHDRMPVILEPEDEGRWLGPGADEEELVGLLDPRPWPEMGLRPVSRAVNDVRNDGPQLLEPPAEEAPRTLF